MSLGCAGMEQYNPEGPDCVGTILKTREEISSSHIGFFRIPYQDVS